MRWNIKVSEEVSRLVQAAKRRLAKQPPAKMVAEGEQGVAPRCAASSGRSSRFRV